jgi:predicted nucleotidyltransferase
MSESALVRDHVVMQIRSGLQVEDTALSTFAARHAIRRLGLFGSVSRDDFGPDSDIDVLVCTHAGPAQVASR